MGIETISFLCATSWGSRPYAYELAEGEGKERVELGSSTEQREQKEARRERKGVEPGGSTGQTEQKEGKRGKESARKGAWTFSAAAPACAYQNGVAVAASKAASKAAPAWTYVN